MLETLGRAVQIALLARLGPCSDGLRDDLDHCAVLSRLLLVDMSSIEASWGPKSAVLRPRTGLLGPGNCGTVHTKDDRSMLVESSPQILIVGAAWRVHAGLCSPSLLCPMPVAPDRLVFVVDRRRSEGQADLRQRIPRMIVSTDDAT